MFLRKTNAVILCISFHIYWMQFSWYYCRVSTACPMTSGNFSFTAFSSGYYFFQKTNLLLKFDITQSVCGVVNNHNGILAKRIVKDSILLLSCNLWFMTHGWWWYYRRAVFFVKCKYIFWGLTIKIEIHNHKIQIHNFHKSKIGRFLSFYMLQASPLPFLKKAFGGASVLALFHFY